MYIDCKRVNHNHLPSPTAIILVFFNLKYKCKCETQNDIKRVKTEDRRHVRSMRLLKVRIIIAEILDLDY